MRSRASLALVAAALLLPPVAVTAQQTTDTPPPEQAAGYDGVGYATVGPDAGTSHRSLAAGSFVEVTALDSGRTVLVMVTRQGAGGSEIVLPATVAQALGLSGSDRRAVRVRAASPAAADRGAIEAGRAFVARAAAPEVLLVPLRRKVDAATVAATSKPQPKPGATVASRPVAAKPTPAKPVTPKPTPAKPAPAAPLATTPRPATGAGYSVQVAALSDAARAQSLARLLGGRVVSAGRIHRIRLGPFADQRSAQAARDAVARRGYGDARIVRDHP